MIRRHISNSLGPPFDPGRQSYSNTKYAAFTRQLHISKLLLCTNHNTQAGFILVSEKFVGATNTLLRGNKGVRKDKRFIKKKKGKTKEKGEKKRENRLYSGITLNYKRDS